MSLYHDACLHAHQQRRIEHVVEAPSGASCGLCTSAENRMKGPSVEEEALRRTSVAPLAPFQADLVLSWFLAGTDLAQETKAHAKVGDTVSNIAAHGDHNGRPPAWGPVAFEAHGRAGPLPGRGTLGGFFLGR